MSARNTRAAKAARRAQRAAHKAAIELRQSEGVSGMTLTERVVSQASDHDHN